MGVAGAAVSSAERAPRIWPSCAPTWRGGRTCYPRPAAQAPCKPCRTYARNAWRWPYDCHRIRSRGLSVAYPGAQTCKSRRCTNIVYQPVCIGAHLCAIEHIHIACGTPCLRRAARAAPGPTVWPHATCVSVTAQNSLPPSSFCAAALGHVCSSLRTLRPYAVVVARSLALSCPESGAGLRPQRS